MGGEHKGDLCFQGQTFMERIIGEFEACAQKIWISYGEKIRREYPGCVSICDEHPGCGPIGGIHAGLRKCQSDFMMVAACDMPFVKMELYQLLERELLKAQQESENTYAGVVPVDDGRIHPLAAIYKKEMIGCLEEQIAGKDYRLRSVLSRQNILYVDVSGNPRIRQMLKNINTVAEYDSVCAAWKNAYLSGQGTESEEAVKESESSVGQKIIAVCGVKNSGKTTLLEKLVKELSKRGVKTAVIKHDGHDFACDIEGTDSYRLFEAGAYGTAVFYDSRILVHNK